MPPAPLLLHIHGLLPPATNPATRKRIHFPVATVTNPQTWWLKTTEVDSLTALEAGSPRSRAGHASSGSHHPAAWALAYGCLTGTSTSSVSLSAGLYKDPVETKCPKGQ